MLPDFKTGALCTLKWYPKLILHKEKTSDRQMMPPFPSVLRLVLVVLVWAAAWLASMFLAECLEIRVNPGMRGGFIQPLVPALPLPWFWLSFFFSFQSWRGEDPAFGGVRRSALALAVCLPSIQLENQRRGNTVKFVSALGTSTAGLLNLISSFWCWHCSLEQGPKTNLILLWNRVATLDEGYSQWAGIH